MDAAAPQGCRHARKGIFISCVDINMNIVSAHEGNISGGRFEVDAASGYYIVNPEQNLPRNEKRLRPFLTSRAPSWNGTFGVAPSSEQFRDVLQNYSIFM